MEVKWNESAVVMLKNMISCCREIQELLIHDQTNFNDNNLDSIEESNKKKAELLAKLNLMILNLSQDFLPQENGSFIKKLEESISSLNTEKQQEIRLIIKDLQAELDKCYNSVIKNIDYVFSGIKQFKDMWDRILASKSQIDSTYDRLGNKV